MIAPPRSTPEDLEKQLNQSIDFFRRERLEEPVDLYSTKFDEYLGSVEDLLETTLDLKNVDSQTLADILTNKDGLEAFRYLSGPPISEDDLKTLVEAISLSPRRLKADGALLEKISQTVLSCIDRRRFPWVSEGREPSEAERNAAILASAALMAYQRIQTMRRGDGKSRQEERVGNILVELKFKPVKRRTIDVLGKAPGAGEFCPESKLGSRKADFIVGNWDQRILAIECKVSNSALNSVKRLNNDAAAKAEAWLKDFGSKSVVPIAVLSGVYKLTSLIEAQERGLTLFWAHAMDDFLEWIKSTRNAS